MIKNILWDFDGVILDSMPVREYGFRKICLKVYIRIFKLTFNTKYILEGTKKC